MKCPKCHTEVEPGSLYCPKCLTEIPWVQEFNTVETLLEKKKRDEPENLPLQKKKLRKHKWILSRRAGMVLCGLAVIVIGLLCYRQLHTFSALYMRADKSFTNEDYDSAIGYTEMALEKDPDNLSANLLLAKSLEKQGDIKSAIMVLQPMIGKYTDSEILYKTMVRLLSDDGRTGEINKILNSCESQKVLEACSEYICAEPVSSLPPGTYTSVRTVKLSAEYDRIYYTLDGTMPSQQSMRYSEPIILPEGSTELNAFGINSKNISSGIITRKYVIVLNSPEPPVITPDSGDYTKNTKIEVEVPDGCRAYYAFDKIPTASSTEYERPISMPQGSHVFYAILVAANGKVSEASSCEFYLEY